MNWILGLTIVGVITGGVLLGMACGCVKCPKKRIKTLIAGIVGYIVLAYFVIMGVVNGVG